MKRNRQQEEDKYDVFLSYRREGGMEIATLLREALTNRGYRVFQDVESLRSGAFNVKLYEIIDMCSDFLVVLPQNGLDRCNNEKDWVRLEIERAHEGDKNIIPIMLRGFEFPEELPESIDFLRYQVAPPIDTGAFFDAFVERLAESLKSEPELKKTEEKERKRGKRKSLLAAGAVVILLAGFAVKGYLDKRKAEITPQPTDPSTATEDIQNSSAGSQTAEADERTQSDEKEEQQEIPIAESGDTETSAAESEPDLSLFDRKMERFIGDIEDYQRKMFATASESSAKDATSTAAQAIDEDMNTAWIEGAAGSGIGENVVLRFAERTRVDLIGITTGAGSAPDESQRPKSLEIRFSEGEKAWCSLPNESRTLLFALDKPVHTKSVMLIIREVWPNGDQENAAIAEVIAYALRAPSAEDIKNPSEKFQFPGETDYLETYREAVVKAPKGYSVYCYYVPKREGMYDQIRDGERVTVLAEHGDLSCVIVQSDNKVRWVATEYLVS